MTNKQQTRSKTTKTNCFGERMFRIGKQKRGRKSKEKLENYIDIATDKKPPPKANRIEQCENQGIKTPLINLNSTAAI